MALASSDKKIQRYNKINFQQLVLRDQKFLSDNVQACIQALNYLDSFDMNDESVANSSSGKAIRDLKEILTRPENS